MPKKGRITSIETRIRQRNAQNRRQGHAEGYVEEALDLMLNDGIPVCELADYYGVKPDTLRGTLAKAALYRLLKAHGRDFDELNKAVDEANGKNTCQTTDQA